MLSKIKDRTIAKIYTLLLNYHEKIKGKKINSLPFSKRGEKIRIGKDYSILNPQYIEIGENFYAEDRIKIEAIDKYNNQTFNPSIIIGDNVTFISDIHIGCIDRVFIGNSCLLASRIYIADHSHGDTTIESLKRAPGKRDLITKGPVIIGNNVWIGEGVAILPNVTIGENCIIAANAVVTRDLPPNSVVAGVPAKIIKTII